MLPGKKIKSISKVPISSYIKKNGKQIAKLWNIVPIIYYKERLSFDVLHSELGLYTVKASKFGLGTRLFKNQINKRFTKLLLQDDITAGINSVGFDKNLIIDFILDHRKGIEISTYLNTRIKALAYYTIFVKTEEMWHDNSESLPLENIITKEEYKKYFPCLLAEGEAIQYV